jgi:hypothetical protein
MRYQLFCLSDRVIGRIPRLLPEPQAKQMEGGDILFILLSVLNTYLIVSFRKINRSIRVTIQPLKFNVDAYLINQIQFWVINLSPFLFSLIFTDITDLQTVIPALTDSFISELFYS